MGEEEEIPPPQQQQRILIHATSEEIHVDADDDDDDDDYIRPFPSNEWYVLKLSGTGGPKLSVSLDEAPLVDFSCSDDFMFTSGTTSALLGSYLYLITASENFEPGHIYRLDTLKPRTGWIKSVELPFSFKDAAVFVDDASSSIYMFPVFSGFFPPNLADNDGYCYWGYRYDAVEQKGYPIKKPSSNQKGFEWTQFESMHTSIWAFWKERNLVVAPRFPYNTVGVYNITEKSWNNWPTHFPPFPTPDKDGPDECEPYTVINGVLYLLDTEVWLLYAYDLRNGSHQVVELRLDGYKDLWTNGIPHLVSLGDSKICFIWYSTYDDYGDGRRIACATYQISLHPSPPVAILLNKCSLAFGGQSIVNCMLFDSFRGPRAGETKGGEEEEEKKDRLKRNGMDYPNKCYEKILSPQVNINNVCGGRSIYSLASSAAAAANNNNSSILAPSAALSQKYHASVPRIPSASFFRASLASGISLVKKCIKK